MRSTVNTTTPQKAAIGTCTHDEMSSIRNDVRTAIEPQASRVVTMIDKPMVTYRLRSMPGWT